MSPAWRARQICTPHAECTDDAREWSPYNVPMAQPDQRTHPAFALAIEAWAAARATTPPLLLRRIGVGDSTRRRWMSGASSPTEAIVEAVAGELGLTLAEFYSGPQ